MSYVERAIDLTITLQPTSTQPNPTFNGTTSNQVKILGGGSVARNGRRISARITKAGGASLGQAEIRIYNLPLSVMNQLSTLGTPLIYQVGRNTVVVEAGDDIDGMAVIFQGTINTAFATFDESGNATFSITAQVGELNAAASTDATSFNGTAAVATIMASLAQRGSYNFVNNGVTVSLAYPYFSGSILDQIKTCAAAGGVQWFIDDTTNTLHIWPTGGNRDGLIPEVSAATGMVGYPSYTSNGISVRTLYNPSIGFGAKISLKSILTPAEKIWVVYYLDYDLECQEPGGPWFTNLEAVEPGYTIVR